MIKKLFFITSLAFGLVNAQTNVTSFNFTGSFPSDWVTTNQSEVPTTTEWGIPTSYTNSSAQFSGGKGQDGVLNSLGIVNYTSTESGTISNWLMTGSYNVQDGDIVSFYTRKGTSGTTDYPDRLELRYSTAATAVEPSTGPTDLGSYTNLGVSVNPNLAGGFVYPKVWTQYSFTVSGVGTTPVPVSFAFRYFVTDGGANGANSDLIGIDTFSIDRPAMSVSDVNKKSLSVYPNPTTDYLKINSSAKVLSVEVYDLSGNKVSAEFDGTSVNVKSLAKGVYMLRVNTGSEVNTQKFIKE